MKQCRHWWFAYVVTVLSGIFLIPLVRQFLQDLHGFVMSLGVWQSRLAVFVATTTYFYLCFNLLRPRLRHLVYARSFPPIWSAWLLGLFSLAGLDLYWTLGPSSYQATLLEWIGYGGVPLLGVSISWHLHDRKAKPTETHQSIQSISLEEMAIASWGHISDWLKDDSPAKQDFLRHRAIATVLHKKLTNGVQSIGIVGRFGSGKSSIIQWIKEEEDQNGGEPKLIFIDSSCWGFEDSTSSVHMLLSSAVAQIGEEFDAFHFRGLPDEYRRAFSVGGDWADRLGNLFASKRDPFDLIAELSDLMGLMNCHLVFIVEDLDRNSSRNFDLQEVLAFLHRLKSNSNISYILAAGLSSPARIDFDKLCDHIQLLLPITETQSSALIERVRSECLDKKHFSHIGFTKSSDHKWSPLATLVGREREVLSLPQAAAALLNTPRALRHVLGRTYIAWRDSLYGEIDWDDLFILNILRHTTPECFAFMLREWPRFHSEVPHGTYVNEAALDKVRESLNKEWEKFSADAEWDGRAARVLMHSILPASEQWLDGGSGSSWNEHQRVKHERYWPRAVNERLLLEEVLDQEVLRDLEEWIDSGDAESQFVVKLCQSSEYSLASELFFVRSFYDQTEKMLLLGEQVLSRIVQEHGQHSCNESQGFHSIRSLFIILLSPSREVREWLESRIEEASCVSLEMVNNLWHYFGSSVVNGVLLQENQEPVRKLVLETLKKKLRNGNDLCRIVSPKFTHTLHHLVFDGGVNNCEYYVGIEHWKWLAPVFMEALQAENTTVAMQVGYLVHHRREFKHEIYYECDMDVLTGIFGEDASEVIDRMETLSATMAEEHKDHIRQVANSARAKISS